MFNFGSHEDLTHEKAFKKEFREILNLRALRDRNGEKAKNNDEVQEKIDALKARINETQERGIRLQKKFFQKLEENPDISPRELEEFFATDEKLSPSELRLIKTAAKEFQGRRKRSHAVAEKYKKIARKKMLEKGESSDDEDQLLQEAGKELFIHLFGQKPSGTVWLIETNFAIGIRTSVAEDDRIIRPGKESVGGHYTTHYEHIGPYSLGIHISKGFPFIFESYKWQARTVDHEAGHGQNEGVMNALSEQGERIKEDLWGAKYTKDTYFSRALPQIRDRIDTLREKISQRKPKDQTPLSQGKDIKKILEETASLRDMALSRAKDEILTDFQATGNFEHAGNMRAFVFGTSDQKEIQKKLRGPKPLYQYLTEANLDPQLFNQDSHSRALYDSVAQSYNQELTQNAEYMSSLWKVFSKFEDHREMQQELIGFMRQNPIQDWEQRGRRYFSDRFNDRKSKYNQFEKAIEPIEIISSQITSPNESAYLEGDERFATAVRYSPSISEDRDKIAPLTAQIKSKYSEIKNYFDLQYGSSLPVIGLSETELLALQTASGTLTQLISERNALYRTIQESIEKALDQAIQEHPVRVFLSEGLNRNTKRHQLSWDLLRKVTDTKSESLHERISAENTNLSQDEEIRKNEVNRIINFIGLSVHSDHPNEKIDNYSFDAKEKRIAQRYFTDMENVRAIRRTLNDHYDKYSSIENAILQKIRGSHLDLSDTRQSRLSLLKKLEASYDSLDEEQKGILQNSPAYYAKHDQEYDAVDTQLQMILDSLSQA